MRLNTVEVPRSAKGVLALFHIFREIRDQNNNGHNILTEISTFMKHEGLFQEPHLTLKAFALRGFLLPNREFYDQPSFFSSLQLEDCFLFVT